MEIDYGKLTHPELDALKEIGNIGAAHAATALSQLIKRKILINVSSIRTIPVAEIAGIGGGDSAEVALFHVQMLGDLLGIILIIMRRKEAICFARMLKGGSCPAGADLGEAEISTLRQAGSILASSYLNSIGEFLGLSLIPSAPALSFGAMGSLLDASLRDLTGRARIAFCIETEYIEETSSVRGHFLLFPDVGSAATILKGLGISH